MNIGVLGTGIVGKTIGTKLVEKGHRVVMGSRTRDNETAVDWARGVADRATAGTFADAASSGEVVINCTTGIHTLDALAAAGAENLAGKILIDIANPLDFSRGFPPSLTACNTDSLGEQVQRAFPEARVVKTLNTLNAMLMVDPSGVPGDHTIFVSGNDSEAKSHVVDYLGDWFGWKPENVIDLGDITTARGVEMILPLWVRLFAALGTPMFNFHIAKAPAQEEASAPRIP